MIPSKNGLIPWEWWAFEGGGPLRFLKSPRFRSPGSRLMSVPLLRASPRFVGPTQFDWLDSVPPQKNDRMSPEKRDAKATVVFQPACFQENLLIFGGEYKFIFSAFAALKGHLIYLHSPQSLSHHWEQKQKQPTTWEKREKTLRYFMLFPPIVHGFPSTNPTKESSAQRKKTRPPKPVGIPELNENDGKIHLGMPEGVGKSQVEKKYCSLIFCVGSKKKCSTLQYQFWELKWPNKFP